MIASSDQYWNHGTSWIRIAGRRFFRGHGVRATGPGIALSLALSMPAVMAAADAPADLRVLADGADVVVLAKCAGEQSSWDARRRYIVTRATLRPESVLKGTTRGDIIVQVLGGSVDGVSMGASHGATVARGEEAVFFLRRSARGAYHVIHGGSAGKLAIDPRQRGRVRLPGGGTLRVEEVAAAVGGAR